VYFTTISTEFNPLKREIVDFDPNSEDFSPGTINFDNFWVFWWILLDKRHFGRYSRVRARVLLLHTTREVSDNVIFTPKSCIFNDLGLFGPIFDEIRLKPLW